MQDKKPGLKKHEATLDTVKELPTFIIPSPHQGSVHFLLFVHRQSNTISSSTTTLRNGGPLAIVSNANGEEVLAFFEEDSGEYQIAFHVKEGQEVLLNQPLLTISRAQ